MIALRPLGRRLLPGAARRGAARGAAAGRAGERGARRAPDRRAGARGAGAAAGAAARRRRRPIRCWPRWRPRAASCRCGAGARRCRAPRAGCAAGRRRAGRGRRRGARTRRPPPTRRRSRRRRRAAPPARAAAARAAAKRGAALARARGGARRRPADGVAVGRASAATLRALVAAGPGAHRAPRRSRARRDGAGAVAAPAGAHADAGAGAARSTALTAALAGGFATFLLQGVTGSGKTEVYLRVIAAARAAGRGALVLVPEIALTPQLAARFRARFGEDVAVLHSALPPRERLAAWRRLRAGEVGIALGARSAVFAPVRALGVRGRRRGARPARSSRRRAFATTRAIWRWCARSARARWRSSARRRRRSRRVTTSRAGASRGWCCPSGRRRGRCPTVEIVDLRRHPPGAGRPAVGAAGRGGGRRRWRRGEQSILFLNRRGFSTVVLCHACGHVVRCHDCAVSMTYHRGRGAPGLPLLRPRAARARALPGVRVAARLERLGIGTERVEAMVRERFPDARVARLDRDTAGGARIRRRRQRGLRRDPGAHAAPARSTSWSARRW